MRTMTRYDGPGLLERLTSNMAFKVLFGIAVTVAAPVILLSFSQLAECLVLGFVVARVMPWEILGMLLLPIGCMVGYVGLFRARLPAASTADYWLTLICLGVGMLTAGTVIGALLFIDADDPVAPVVPVAIVALSLLVVAGFGRFGRLRRLRAASRDACAVRPR
jgi:hypothetical protein